MIADPTDDDSDDSDDTGEFDAVAHHAGREPDLAEVFAAPVVGDGLRGDTLLDRSGE